MKGAVVAYVRRSTKDQAQSLERQRHEIERYAREHGIEVTRWYEDDGVSGVEDFARPAFQRMVADAEQQRDFGVILVHELSRFGRFDSHQAGAWLHRLRRARVRVQAIEGAVKDPYSIEGRLLVALQQDREESAKLSMRTLSGQRETALKGYRAGGKVPFGYARRRRRTDGVCEIVPRVGRAKRDRAEVIELVPGEPLEVEAVQTIFKMARDGIGYRTIAQHLNDRAVPSPDASRQRTIATVSGRWTSSTVRSLLMNPAFAGDAIWNVRSMPKFHRLEADKIVQLDDFEQDRYRRNSKADWVVVRDAHPALVDRVTFDAVQQKIRSHRSMPRGHVREYLLTGLVSCADCGDAVTGTTRTRRKVVEGQEKVYVDPIYLCGGPLRAKGGHAQVGIPRDGLEKAVLKILHEEIFSEEGIARLERHLRLEVARRSTVAASDGITALERRELDLSNRVAEGARRLLQVDAALIPDVKIALAELKDELQEVRTTLEAKRRATSLAADGERVVRETLDAFSSMASVLRDPSFPLERRREILRRLLPTREGVRPIRVYFERNAQRGWRKALRRVTVRHIAVRGADMTPKMVAGAVYVEAGQPDSPGAWAWEEWLPTSEWELLPRDLEDELEREAVEAAAAGGDGWA